MPIERLIFILVLVMAAAAATVAVALAALDGLQATPMTGFAILILIALCAAYLWRKYSERNDP
jgi:membrane protein implicated in regulation of membrane protease activity